MDWSSYRKYFFLCGLTGVLLLATAIGARAQSGTTSLHGVVTDKSGAAVSGAKITLSNPELGLNRQTTSSAEGDYEFIALPPGTSALMIKFIAPEVLKRFGGAQAYAQAIDDCLNTLAGMLAEPAQIRRLLLGDASHCT